MNDPTPLASDQCAVVAGSHDRIYAAAETIMRCIVWDDTPQGHEYWQNVMDSLAALIGADPDDI